MTYIEAFLGASEGAIVDIPLNLIVTDDWTTPSLLAPLESLGVKASRVPVLLVHDHTQHPSSYEGADRARAEELLNIRDRFATEFGATVISQQGIQHHVLLEQGYVRAGMRILGNDSHTPTLGAAGAFALAGQPANVASAMQTGYVTLPVPSTLVVDVIGTLASGVTMRDAVLSLLGRLRNPSGLPEISVGRVLQFQGWGLAFLTLAERAVLANSAPEAVAWTSVFVPDSKQPADLILDLSTVEPTIAFSPSPLQASPSSLATLPRIDRVFVGTCAGGTVEEIRAFAEGLRRELGDVQRVVTETIVAPVSASVAQVLEEDGTLADLRSWGITVDAPGCSACFGFGHRRLRDGEVAISTGNRNARGRMGSPHAEIHLTSGWTAAMAAAHGSLWRDSSELPGPSRPSESAPEPDIRITWPTTGNIIRLHGVITTDDITPSSVPGIGRSNEADPAILRALLFHYLDAEAAARDLSGMTIVADHAFGMGSNRASSVLALKEAGIVAVLARSVAPVYALGAAEVGLDVRAVGDDNVLFERATPTARITMDGDELMLLDGDAPPLRRSWYPARRPSEHFTGRNEGA